MDSCAIYVGVELAKGIAYLIVGSAPPIMLSRFLINLRRVDSPQTTSFANESPSGFSVPNFRIPTMDDVVGNLGEPLDFEYTMGDDDTTVGRMQCDSEVYERYHTAALDVGNETEREP